MINRNPTVRLGFAVWLLGLLCVGCSGSPLGNQLTERLSEPDDPVEETVVPIEAAVNIPAREQLTEQPLTEEPLAEQPLTEQPSELAELESAEPESADPVEAPSPAIPLATTTPAPPPLNPTPYRLRLLLPAADPAAPAEAVTQALREAGLLFEVETIERLSSEPMPTSTPVPTPLAPSP